MARNTCQLPQLLFAFPRPSPKVKYSGVPQPKVYHKFSIRDGPFDIQGGGGLFFEKIVCFPTGVKKVKYLQQS